MSDTQDLDRNLIADHEYDGIRELDNPLPNWWLATFFATIIFAFLYWIHYEIAGGPSTSAELAQKLAHIEQSQKVAQAAKPQISDQDLLALADNPEALEQGGQVFAANCAACHGAKGEGIIGPNLTDRFWLHGSGKPNDIAQVVRLGVTDKGMPAWDSLLKEEQIQSVTAFIFKMRGTVASGGKAPEGQEIAE